MRETTSAFLMSLVILIGSSLWLSYKPSPYAPSARKGQHATRLSRLPVYFIANRGQGSAGVAYSVQGRWTQVNFTASGVEYLLRQPTVFEAVADSPALVARVKQEFLDANPDPVIEGVDLTPARVNYFRGAPDQWVSDIETYGTIVYRDLWPGIDLVFSGPDGNLKYTYRVRPGADPRQIGFVYRGATSVRLTAKGSLCIDTPAGGFADDAPVAWQDWGERRQPVSARFRLSGEEVRFEVGSYERTRELILDPVVLIYSGYLGTGSEEKGRAIAVDQTGAAYVTGYTRSTDAFATSNWVNLGNRTGGAVFVAKINPAGTGLVYATYLGGTSSDAEGIAVDASGNVYVAGFTHDDGFPTTEGAFDRTPTGRWDAFVFKLNAAGNSLLYSTYIGGTNDDRASGIVIDSAGNAYVAGVSNSYDFPVSAVSALGFTEAFVCKVNTNGTGLMYSVLLGGSGFEEVRGIAIDSANNVYVTGETSSTDLLVGVGPDVTYNGGHSDAFIFKLNATGTALFYSGYLGGSASDQGVEIDVDPAGNAYITGQTTSSDFPTTEGAFDKTYNGNLDGFVTKVSLRGADLAYSTFLGGASIDLGRDIAVDRAGNAYILGWTESADFPVNSNGPDTTANGRTDVFITKLNAAGSGVAYSGYIGGALEEEGLGITVDGTGAAYLTGFTNSDQTTLPVTAGPDVTFNRGGDVFVAKVSALPGTAGPTMAFRNRFNAIEMNTFPSTLLRNAGGNFRLDPAVAMSASGRAFIAARDSFAGIWINFLKPDNTYNGWVAAGGNSAGNPDVAAAGETAWIAFRDPWNSYWVRSYNPGSGFSDATWIQGILATDPKIAACPNGDIYVTGRDHFNGIWTRRFNGSWQGWRFIGGITKGTPAIACGADNAAYIAIRDPGDNMWLARVFQEGTSSWHYGEGVFDGDLQVAVNGSLIHVVGLSSSAPWYRTWEAGTGWQDWTTAWGVVAHCAPAIYNGNLYLAGLDFSNNLYWWSSLNGSWTNFGPKSVSPGSRFSAGAR